MKTDYELLEHFNESVLESLEDLKAGYQYKEEAIKELFDYDLSILGSVVGFFTGTGLAALLSAFNDISFCIAGCVVGFTTPQVIKKAKLYKVGQERYNVEQEIHNCKEKIKVYKKERQRSTTLGVNIPIWDDEGRTSYCFKAGTLVLAENGYKNIEDVLEGDLVYSYNMETKMRELKKVVRTFINDGKEMLKITVNGIVMELTPNHTCYVNEKWTLASEIKAGDKLLDCDNNVLLVESVVSSNPYDKVYNFEVEDNHNYFVTDLNILVHNDSCLDEF